MKKKILIVFALLVFILVIVVNYSTVETRFKCEGHLTLENQEIPQSLYMKLEKYRWWVYLWSDGSTGTLWVEVPNTVVRLYHRLVKAGENYIIYYGDNERSGQLSLLSGSLILNVHIGHFEGSCQKFHE